MSEMNKWYYLTAVLLLGVLTVPDRAAAGGYDRNYDRQFDRRFDTSYDRSGYDTHGLDRNVDRNYDTGGTNPRYDKNVDRGAGR
jgi:hypothetical protein